jgi:catechol 2,3-dioxygenase-like lactoylglutathione lyase family enzyme
MKVTRTLHSSVNVEGHLDESVEFYRQLFGMGDDPRPIIPGIEGHWFNTVNAQLHLVDAPEGPGPIRPAGHHVCFAVTDLDEAIAELERKGIPYAEGAQGTVVQIWIVDPAGNTIELQQETEAQA